MLKLVYVVTSLLRSLQSQMHFPQDPIEWKFCPVTSNEDSPLKTVHIPRPPLPQQQPLLLSYWMAKQFSYVQTRQQIPQSIQSQLLYQVCQNRGIVKRVIYSYEETCFMWCRDTNQTNDSMVFGYRTKHPPLFKCLILNNYWLTLMSSYPK